MFVDFKNVSRVYKSGGSEIRALDNVSFGFEEGKLTIILGPSGSGKSTLLNLLGGMDTATSGSITVGGKNVTDMNQKQLTQYRRTDIGFVFQFYNILPNLTAYENVDMAHRLCQSSISAEEALNAVGLGDRMLNFPAQLSGGELQRVSIARALSKNPRIMLCDEPTGALDSETGKRVISFLKKMVEEYHTTVIIVTHNAAIAGVADTVLRLKDGHVESIVKNEKPLAVDEVEW